MTPLLLIFGWLTSHAAAVGLGVILERYYFAPRRGGGDDGEGGGEQQQGRIAAL